MIKGNISVYYATKLELKMWSSLNSDKNQSLLSKTKYNACVVATCFIEPLKHLAGSVETLLVKVPLSLAFSAGSYINQKTGLERWCSKRIITNLTNFKEQVGSFKLNSINGLLEICLGFILIPASVIGGYRRFNTFNTEGPIKGLQQELSKMNKTKEMTTTEIYSEINKKNK